ncbi:threonine synthase [Enorma massiliensis]|uniref:Threonine synthase n=1 Tax=Enorma massiliensis TaxID=1472761 RepID=A0A1Y3U697_9ACTN|nr:threonine synthase [Enorma massiliensis]OUN41939.1 threonine synthase [Enorma massiliensis]
MNSYHSTRSRAVSCTAKEAIRTGIAPDGGLFVSDALGSEKLDVTGLAEQSYADIANSVLQLLLPDYTADEIAACVHEAYDGTFASAEVTPLVPLVGHEADEGGQPFVLELFHGPTSAFKDVALQMLPRLMARTGSASDTPAESIMIVTATSGDTGKAALAGFADAAGTGITVFYPEGKVSRVQELQMTTQTGGNVSVCGVRGNFDDAQSTVKRIFADRELAERLAERGVVLSSANSINVGRLVPQVVYYFAAYAQLLRAGAIEAGDEVEFCVPTGNFGDVLAGYYAKLLGLPVEKLIVASDKNNVLYDFLTTGVYDRKRPFFTTISPSMDILISSNLERMLYYLSDGDCELVASLMEQLAHEGRYEVPAELLARIQEVFACGWADEDEVRAAIGSCWRDHRYVIDPHTACGYHVLGQVPAVPAARARVLLSTASPYKFPRAVAESLGLDVPADDFACMEVLAKATGTTPPVQLATLRQAAVLHDDVVDVDGMASYVEHACHAKLGQR